MVRRWSSCAATQCSVLLSFAAAILVLSADDARSQTPPSAKPAFELQEVVVTARKRQEKLQEIPLSVSVVEGELLQKAAISNSTDLFGRVPNLYFTRDTSVGPNQSALFLVLRGVGANPVLEPSTGLFVDGVYQSGAGFDIGFLDLERIEVLRGPQGTLFGRNTEAGAINLVTRKPGRDFQAKAFVEFDEYDTVRGQVSMDGPVSETVSLGGAVRFDTTDGYLRNVTLNSDQLEGTSKAARFALRWLPGELTTVDLSVDGFEAEGGTMNSGVRVTDGEQYIVRDDIVLDELRNNVGAALNISHDFGAFTLASISGWRRTHTEEGFDQDGLAVPMADIQYTNIDQYTFGQELRLESSGEDSRLDWLVGVYGFRETNDFYFTIDYPDSTGWTAGNQILRGVFGIINTLPERTGWAGFGQLSYDLTERLELTAGVRYSKEETEFSVYNFLRVPLINLVIDRTSVPPAGDFQDDDTSPNVSLAMKWTPDFMTYATVAKGFKAGGFNRAMSSGESVRPTAFASETAISYELGLKSALAGGRLLFNAALFNVDISDQQLLAVVQLPGDTVPTTRIFNVGKSRSRGFELELAARPVDSLTLSAEVGYTDAEFRRYIDPSGRDRAGDRLPQIPQETVSLSAEYRQRAWSEYDWSLYAAGRHVGGYQSGVGTEVEPAFDLPGYDIVDVEVALHRGDRWKLAGFARNALDEFARVTTRNGGFMPRTPDNQFNRVLPPRTFGANFTYRW